MPSITIQISPETLQALQQQGFSLYAFKAVQTRAGGAAPTVWLATHQFSESTEISWQDQYSAYVSNSQIIPNAQIMAAASYAIDLGSTLEITSPGGGTVTNSGQPGTISILNQVQQQFTTGISQAANMGDGIVCALPLYGNMLDVIVPVDTVLLCFGTNRVNPGTVIYQLFSQGLLIDATAAGGAPTVSFDINNGWDAGGASWATVYWPNTNIVPLLIQNG